MFTTDNLQNLEKQEEEREDIQNPAWLYCLLVFSINSSTYLSTYYSSIHASMHPPMLRIPVPKASSCVIETREKWALTRHQVRQHLDIRVQTVGRCRCFRPPAHGVLLGGPSGGGGSLGGHLVLLSELGVGALPGRLSEASSCYVSASWTSRSSGETCDRGQVGAADVSSAEHGPQSLGCKYTASRPALQRGHIDGHASHFPRVPSAFRPLSRLVTSEFRKLRPGWD
ncbi:hypothetical protein QTO34_019147 [Cnephaeus nilssonii]|uniref:Uncharacterized protein n=1 Tax=Cnephaeus nilssonii TaxID=3371016 RepID=A0AA40LNM7_CNENI|nr:hypothetical protein QTO34_019147 [Eptesicus nilssonii]